MNPEQFIEDNAPTIFLSIALVCLMTMVILPQYYSTTPYLALVVFGSAFAVSIGYALYLVTKEYGDSEREKQRQKEKREEE